MPRRRRREKRTKAEPSPAAADYAAARRRLLERSSFAVVMETTYEGGWEADATDSMLLAVFAQGPAIVHVSSGALISGPPVHAAVGAATDRLRDIADRDVGLIPRSAGDEPPPGLGRVLICLVVDGGRHAVEVLEDDLGSGRHELSALFYAAHEVFTQLRLAHLAEDPEPEHLDHYAAPRWRARELSTPDDSPLSKEQVFAEIERCGARLAIVSFSGGNDEGAADEIALAGAGGEALEMFDPWAGDLRDAEQAFVDALQAPLYDAVGFAGGFTVHGTVTWDVAARTITLRDAMTGEDDEMYEAG